MIRLGLFIAALSGCGSYDITLNDYTVYGAPKIFLDFELPDEALNTCISQQIIDQRITSAEDRVALNCSNAGIETLEGLSLFSQLEQLKLSNNRIRNLVVLGQLRALKAVWLDGNMVIDPVPLQPLPELRWVDLSGNSHLQCPKKSLFGRVETLKLPNHCSDLAQL